MTSSLTTCVRGLTPRYRRVQRDARELYRIWSAIGTDENLLHPMWREGRAVFGELAAGGVPPDFLSHPFVRHMLYRTGYGELERIEAAYLESTEPWIRDPCGRYREPRLGQPVLDWPGSRSSVSTLNKLYFARIAETVPPAELETIMEFGGGYGLMCHGLMELVEPRLTYVVVDLPELLALQYVYLRGGSSIPVTPQTETPVRIRERTVNLLPVQLLASIELECDLFISTFALSETPVSLQRYIAEEREFFRASSLYLTGQNTRDDHWREYSLEEMDCGRRAVEQLYDSVRVEPFPVVSAWELTATRGRRQVKP